MHKTAARIFLFCLLSLGACDLHAQLPPPQPAGPLFKERPYGPVPPPQPTPEHRKNVFEEPNPIPTSWIVSGIAVVVLAIAALLYGSARRWRSSNLFDRQYRFPKSPEPALRFGAPKSGGHMATVQLAGSSSRRLTKDA